MLADPDLIYNDAEFQKKLKEDFLATFSPLEIKGLTFSNLMIDAGTGPLSLKELKSDFSLAEGNVNYTCAVADLLLSRAFILAAGLEPLSEVVEEDLHLSGDLGVSLLAGSDPAGMLVSVSLKEQKLGGASGNLEMEVPKASLGLPGQDGQERLKGAALSVDDRGLIDFIVACKAALEYDDFDEAKNEMLEELKMELEFSENSGELTQKTLSALIALLENGGTLDIAFKPAKPVSVDELNDLAASSGDLNAAEYSITYKPRAD
jgi:hypothetical protein